MFRFLPFLGLLLFLAGWMPIGAAPSDPGDTGPAFISAVESSDTQDDGEARGKIDPDG